MSILAYAAQHLAAGNPLGALNLVAGLESPHARALRGIALAQLREYERARIDLRAAIGGLERAGDHADAARAAAALAEVELSSRNLTRARAALERQERALFERLDSQ